MDPEIAFIELGQDGKEEISLSSSSSPPSIFETNLEQRIGMIGSGIVIALSLIGIVFFAIKIWRKNRQRASSSYRRGMFDKNMEMMAEFPYSNLNNEG